MKKTSLISVSLLRGVFHALAASAALLFAGSAAAENILVVSDIHFDPFAQCKQSGDCGDIKAIAASDDVANWHFSTVRAATYLEETNSKNLQSSLEEIHRLAVSRHVDRVFVLGDMLEHGFRADFDKYAGLRGREPAFSSNVILYLLHQIRAATNNARIDFTLGNNDSDSVHYEFPVQAFLDNLTGGLFHRHEIDARGSFAGVGYSKAPLNPSVEVLCVNGNLLSKSKPLPVAAHLQLSLLKRDLEHCRMAGTHAIILIHEPFGMKAFKSFLANKPLPVLSPALQREYLDLLLKYSDCVSGIYAGHLHREYFQSLGGKIPVFGTVALNSVSGNNPGFKIIRIDDQTGRLDNYTTYISDLSQHRKPWQILYRFRSTYGRDGWTALDVINHFPSNYYAPAARKYRALYSAASPLPQPIDEQGIWPYYVACMAHFDAVSFSRFLRDEFPETRIRPAAVQKQAAGFTGEAE